MFFTTKGTKNTKMKLFFNTELFNLAIMKKKSSLINNVSILTQYKALFINQSGRHKESNYSVSILTQYKALFI